MRGGPWTEEEKIGILDYCESDVVALRKRYRDAYRLLGQALDLSVQLENDALQADVQTAIGKKLARRRRAWEERYGEQNAVPPLVQAALDNLRAVAAKRLESGEEAEARIVEILARAAQDIRSGS